VFAKIHGDDHGEDLWDFFLGSLLEMLSVVACYFMIDSFLGRVYSLATAGIVCGIGTIGICIYKEENFGIFTNIGRFGAQIGLNILFLYTPEVYQISLRGIGTGFANLMQDLGGLIMAITLISIYEYSTFLPFFVLGVLAIIMVILSFWLPEETRGEVMDD
jgi:hypothetical protein